MNRFFGCYHTFYFTFLKTQRALVITVDTSIAHLAGALGISTWLLLPYETEWRWLLDRDYSPWYPTMKLYRQKISGDWATVITEVCKDLEKKINEHESLSS